MRNILTKCDHCSKEIYKSTGHYNRAKKLGAGIYCDRKCAGLGRRTNETLEEKREIKSWYDMFLRESMTEDEKIFESFSQLVYFHIDYTRNPDKYKKWRQKRMPKHIEYCRQPEYKEYKKGYDEQYRAKKDYGEYWEAAIVLKNLEKVIPSREARRENKLYHKSTTKRKRLWQKLLNQSKNLQPRI